MAHESKRTTNHDTIRKWAEERGGRPAVVASTWDGTSGVLRIDFDGKEDDLEELSWDEFFRVFDENELEFLYQEELAEGGESRFFKFVARDSGAE